MTRSQCPHCLAEIARLDGDLAKAKAELAEVAEVRRGGVFRSDETLAAIIAAPSLASLIDPTDPYPAELVGQQARTVIALDAETFDMGSSSLANHYEYKRRRNEQFAAYEALAKERDSLAEAAHRSRADLLDAQTALDERTAQLDAMRKPIGVACVERVTLNGHIDIATQCRDYLAFVAETSSDESSKTHDFVEALDVVIAQLDLQRRRANWYEAAYDAGKAKLIESATANATADLNAKVIALELGDQWRRDDIARLKAERDSARSEVSRLKAGLVEMRAVVAGPHEIEWHHTVKMIDALLKESP